MSWKVVVAELRVVGVVTQIEMVMAMAMAMGEKG